MRGRCLSFFFFNDTATTEIYTLSLHDALPISAFRGALLYVVGERVDAGRGDIRVALQIPVAVEERMGIAAFRGRSEEHTSELQSRSDLVCRLLLEKKQQTCNDSIMLSSGPRLS